MSKRLISVLAVITAIEALFSIGCTNGGGPYLGALSVPIPVSPFFQKHEEDKAWEHERYDRVPILGPITSGGQPVALDPPSDDQVIRALEKVHTTQGGIPFLWERQRNDVRIIKEKIADYVDPVRVYPVVGPAQQHHSHWKCTVYYSDAVRVGWPLPHTVEDEDAVEVIYIDHNHLHMAGGAEPGGLHTNY